MANKSWPVWIAGAVLLALVLVGGTWLVRNRAWVNQARIDLFKKEHGLVK